MVPSGGDVKCFSSSKPKTIKGLKICNAAHSKKILTMEMKEKIHTGNES